MRIVQAACTGTAADCAGAPRRERASIRIRVCSAARACTLVAAERQRESFSPDEKIVLLLCGGNVSFADLVEWAEIIKSGGAAAWAQINHPGRQAPRTLTPADA